jgi:hypothetical protein
MKKHPKTIAVIGAGSLGCILALFLDRFGFRVVLLECQEDILRGAPQVSFINQADGFEYYKRHHRRTGQACIEGALVKSLVFPSSLLSTTVCTDDNPIRFLVSEGSARTGRITPSGFLSNAAHMMKHYSRMYHAMRDGIGLPEADAETVLGRGPRRFMSQLSPNEYSDVNGVIAGVSGNGCGINMPHYYALVKAALGESQVVVRCAERLSGITQQKRGRYAIKLGGSALWADQVLVCTSHHIPRIARLIAQRSGGCGMRGTYYLNSMTFLRLPATANRERLSAVSRINFTLMEQHGGMYACIVPPTGSYEGLAAVYYPDATGSQVASIAADACCDGGPPDEWDDHVASGLPNSSAHVERTVAHIQRLYPFLAAYANVSHTECRTVFNASVRGSDGGRDRRVRELDAKHHCLTADGLVTGWAAPKWTNAESAALIALDYVLIRSGLRPLTKCRRRGCGPTYIDVAPLREMISFRHLSLNRRDAEYYAKISRLPARMVSAEHSRDPPPRPD